MKSALTAAFSDKAPAKTSKLPDAKDDLASYPQLRDPTAELNTEEAECLEAARAEAESVLPVGSMTTYNGDMFDYEVNPRSRRAGTEMVGSFRSGSLEMKTGSLQANFMATSLGSDMTAGKISDIRGNMGESPCVSLLKELPADKITSRTGEGKKLRRNVLRGAIVVFVTAGYSGKRFIYERAKELGCRTVILDAEDSWSKTLLDTGVIEKFIGVDFADVDSAFDKCMAAIQTVKAELGEVDGILTFCEIAVPLATRLCEVCGLPCNPSAAVDNARNKHSTRAIMSAAGLATPKNFLIKEPGQVDEAAGYVGFPAVLKPIHGAASLGVIRVENHDELTEAYTKVLKELQGAKVVAGAIMEGNEEDADGNAGGWICLDMIMEEYLDGPEVDCDIVFSEGKCVYGIIADNWPTIEPYFNETGSNCPSILPMEHQKELIDLSVKTVEALGFQLGVFHVEGKYTSRGPRLIEVNCRMGGGPIRDINLMCWGVDLVEEQLLCSVGVPSRPQAAPKPLNCIAEYSVNAKKTGILQHTDYLGDWPTHPDVKYCRPTKPAGSKVVCVDDGMPTWVCEMMVVRPTVEEAIELVKTMEVSIQEKLPIV